MVPGFLTESPGSPGANREAAAPVQLAGLWDFNDGSGERKKICGQKMTETFCTGLVLWCRDFRMCRWSDSFAFWKDSITPYPCGVCVGIDSPDDW